MLPALKSIVQPSSRKRGRYGAYVSLTSPNGDREPFSPGGPGRSRSFLSFRAPKLRTVLILLFLVFEFVIGYVAAKYQLALTSPVHVAEKVPASGGSARPPGPGVGALSPGDDFFFSRPIGMDHLPPVPLYNVLPNSTVLDQLQKLQSPVTPLFVPFTRNNEMLKQTVLSYIAVGWPREQIIVLENTGTMDANPKRQLSRKNPFYLDYDILQQRYGVSILRTPTLLSFAQVQNYMVALAMSKGWKWYYWTHQDVAVLSEEDAEDFVPFYEKTLRSLLELTKTMEEGSKNRWAGRFYNFDWLTLVNVNAIAKVGAWDTFIPYYNTDCDWYERARLTGMTVDEERVGLIYDLHKALDDPEKKFFGYVEGQDSIIGASVNSSRFENLKNELNKTATEKNGGGDRNSWQNAMTGGQGEPWTYNPKGFQKAWWMTAEKGREIFQKKWDAGPWDCAITKMGRKLGNEWTYD